MKTLLTISLGISLALGCSDSPSPGGADATDGFRFVFNDDEAAITAVAKQTRDAYLAQLVANGAPATQMPGIQINTLPPLVHWNGTNVVIPQWVKTDAAQRDRLVAWMGSESAAQELYEGLFHWFYAPHELTHFVQQERGMVNDAFGQELLANEMAIAFWRVQPGGQEKLDRLEALIKLALPKLTPSPGFMYDPTYVDKNYAVFQSSVDDYGTLQFSQLLDAFKRQSSLNFATLLTSNIATGIKCGEVNDRLAMDCPGLNVPDYCQTIISVVVELSRPACNAQRDTFLACFQTKGNFTPSCAAQPPIQTECDPLGQALVDCSSAQ